MDDVSIAKADAFRGWQRLVEVRIGRKAIGGNEYSPRDDVTNGKERFQRPLWEMPSGQPDPDEDVRPFVDVTYYFAHLDAHVLTGIWQSNEIFCVHGSSFKL
jgi:hypothetical protein